MKRSRFCGFAAFLLVAGLAWSAETAIEDEAFLLFLAESIEDEETLTDPLHMVEMMGMEDAPEGAEEVEDKVQTEQEKRLQEGQ